MVHRGVTRQKKMKSTKVATTTCIWTSILTHCVPCCTGHRVNCWTYSAPSCPRIMQMKWVASLVWQPYFIMIASSWRMNHCCWVSSVKRLHISLQLLLMCKMCLVYFACHSLTHVGFDVKLQTGAEYKLKFRSLNSTSEKANLLGEVCSFVDMVPPFRDMATKSMGAMIELQKGQLYELGKFSWVIVLFFEGSWQSFSANATTFHSLVYSYATPC